MSKLFLGLVLFCSLIALALSQSASIQWTQTEFSRYGYNLMKVSIDKAEFAATSFEAIFTAGAAQNDPADAPTDYWVFGIDEENSQLDQTLDIVPLWGFAPLIEGKVPCWNENTKQLAAYRTFITPSSTNTFTIDLSSNFLASAPESVRDGQFTVICPFRINFEKPVTNTNFNVDLPSVTDPISTSLPTPTTLTFAAEPLVDFKTAKITQDTEHYFSTSTLDIEFTTNTIGAYRINIINGPMPSYINYNDGHYADYFCSAGKTKKFARISYFDSYAIVYVPEASDKDVIKCTILLDNSNVGEIVRSERTSITISVLDVTVARTVDTKLYPSLFAANLGGISSDSFDLSLYIGDVLSTTPINTNSTLELKFSEQFDPSNLIIPQGQSEYRAYTACSSNHSTVEVTVFVDGGARTITLKDFAAPLTHIDCQFHFQGSDIFKFHEQAHMGSVSVKIDGSSLLSYYGNTQWSPLYYLAKTQITAIEQVITDNGETYGLVDQFTIKDRYSSIHNTLRDPVLSIALPRHQQFFTDEQHSSQVKCQISTPTSTTLNAVDLKWVPEHYVWTAPLKDLIGVETFKITLKCERTIPKIVSYGLDITPKSYLQIEVLEFVEKKRYGHAGSSRSSIPQDWPIQAKTQPSSSSYPNAQIGYQHISASVVPVNVNQFAQADADTVVANILGALGKVEISTDDKLYADWTVATAAPAARFIYTQSGTYANINHAEDIFDRRITKNGNYEEVFSYEEGSNGYITYSNIAGPYGFAETPNASTITVQKYFTFTPSTDAGALSYETQSTSYQFNTNYNALTIGQATVVDANVRVSASSLPSTAIANSFANPVAACGAKDQLFVIPRNAKYNELSTVSDPTSTQQWEAFVARYEASNRVTIECQLDETCSYNADCQQSSEFGTVVCRAGKCTGVAAVQAPFISIDATPTNYNRGEYFNSAAVTSFVGVAIVVVAAMLF